MNRFLFVLFLTFIVAIAILRPTLGIEGTSGGLDNDLKGAKIPSKTDDGLPERKKADFHEYSADELLSLTEKAESFEFKSDVSRVMNIIINSIYSNKEVFLRELISNASDALDKLRFLSLTDPKLIADNPNFEIRIQTNPEANTITITDTGIGMTKDDLITKLGVIAKSGTKDFFEAVQTGDMNLIGQFGVGFYSAFLVSEKVTVFSKHNDDPKQYIWESSADNSFSIVEDPHGNTLGRGTRIVLHLKEEASEFTKIHKIKQLIKTYSEFINFPIFLWEEATVEVPKEPEVKDTEEVSLDSEESKEEIQTQEKKQETTTVKQFQWVRQNELQPIWTRNPKDLTEEDYKNFYKTFSKEPQEPITYLHFVGEGEIEFRAILYIPAQAPQGMFDPKSESAHKGLRLYVKRVFITDDFKDMFPTYLSFIKGMVDSDNLPLNVSREVLQQDRVLSLIKKKLTRKVISMLQDLAEDKEKFAKFYKQFSTNLKYGVATDPVNKPRLAKLLRFHSSLTEKKRLEAKQEKEKLQNQEIEKIKDKKLDEEEEQEELTSFDDYVARMKPSQTQIYYLTGETLDAVHTSPFVEKLLSKGYEVLYLIDPIDEWMISNIPRYDNKHPLVDVSKEGLKIEGDDDQEDPDQTKERKKQLQEQFQSLLALFQTELKGKISKAVISDNLVSTPSAITAGTAGFTANMERLMKAQSFADKEKYEFMRSQRILEINPHHPILKELNSRLNKDPTDPVVKDLAILVYETASVHSGFSIEDPSSFVSRVHRMIKLSLGVNEDKKTSSSSSSSSSAEQELESSSNDLL